MGDRKIFSDSVIPLPDKPGLTQHGLMVNAAQPASGSQTMKVLFSLSLPQAAQAELEERVARGEVVSFEEMAKKYAPNPSDVEQLTKWLQAQGFKVLQVAPDGIGVYAQATTSQIEQSLQVKMVRVTKDGLTYTAAQNAPSLPSNIGNSVNAIIGLQPFRQAHKHSRRRVPKAGNRVPHSVCQGSAVPTPNISNKPPYLVREVLKGLQRRFSKRYGQRPDHRNFDRYVSR